MRLVGGRIISFLWTKLQSPGSSSIRVSPNFDSERFKKRNAHEIHRMRLNHYTIKLRITLSYTCLIVYLIAQLTVVVVGSAPACAYGEGTEDVPFLLSHELFASSFLSLMVVEDVEEEVDSS